MKDFIKDTSNMLCPPGNGVYTVHTAKENKEILHNQLFKTIDPNEVQKKWQSSLHQFNDNKPVLFGITMDTGGGIQRGANWGPLFIRTELLKDNKLNYFDIGDTRTIPHLIHDKYLNEKTIIDCRLSLYGTNNNLPVSALSIAETFCNQYFNLFRSPLITLGGDHSVSYPVVKSWLKYKSSKNIRSAIIHFDAHTDLMDNRLGIDICFATWAKKIMPYLDKKSDLIQIGIRSSGNNKDHWEKETGVQQFWSKDINENGVDYSLKQILDYLNKEKIEEVYLSFDIDALDSKYASSTGTPEQDGLEPHQCVHIIREIAKVTKITSADLVEVAPFVSSTKKDIMSPEPQTTLQSSTILVKTFLDVLTHGV